jgi:hypothetical protein
LKNNRGKGKVFFRRVKNPNKAEKRAEFFGRGKRKYSLQSRGANAIIIN